MVKQKILASAHIARQQSYIAYCLVTPTEQRLSIWEMWPLEGDPSKEEIEKMNKEAEIKMQEDYEAGQKQGMEWIKQYQKKGLLKQKAKLN